MTTDPLVVEVLRSAPGGPAHVESRHRVRLAVSDASGRLVAGFGDVEAAVFPRSAIKLVQALPLIESGAADALGLTGEELALAAASHSGEEGHVATAAAMLAKAGRDESCLVCGAQWPEREADRGRLHRLDARPTRLHNNCSGKHAGFVCFAVHAGIDPAGYGEPEHPVQREIASALADVTGVDIAGAPRGRDGCSIPTWALPLTAIARGMARLGTGEGLAPSRAAAAKRLIAAALTHPFMVAGTHRLCTDLMEALDRTVYVKTGAEGVYTAWLPSLGLGVALKAEDGATRAAQVAVAHVVAGLIGRVGDPALSRFLAPKISDWNKVEVGGLRLEEGSAAALARISG
jgi:L-asparaginase II